jgi:hypothetical protein
VLSVACREFRLSLDDSPVFEGSDKPMIDSQLVLLNYAPQVAELLARTAMEWVVTVLAESGVDVDTTLINSFPTVKMFTPTEIESQAAIEYGNGEALTVAYVTDGMATEYIRVNPTNGELSASFE